MAELTIKIVASKPGRPRLAAAHVYAWYLYNIRRMDADDALQIAAEFCLRGMKFSLREE